MSNENPSVELAPLKGSIVLDLEQFNDSIEEVEERILDLKEIFNDLIIKIHIAGLDEATEQILNFSDLLDHMDKENTTNIKIEGIEAAREQLESLKTQLNELNGESIEINIKGLDGEQEAPAAAAAAEEGGEGGEGFTGKLKELSEKLNEFGMNYSFMFTMPIVAGMVKAIEVTSNLNSNVELAKKEFGAAGAAVQQFGENSVNSLDLSQQETLQLVNSFGLAGNALGGTKAQTAALAIKLTQLSQNMNLATGGTISLQTASQALVGMLGGNSFALKSLGINLTTTALNQEALNSKFHKSYTTLTPYQQAIIQTDLVQKDLNKSLGSLKGNLGGTYGQFSKLKAEALRVAEDMGETLTPQLKILTKKVESLANWFEKLGPKQKDFVRDCIELAGILPVVALGIGSIVKVFELFEGVLGIVDGLLAANPIGLAIMGIVAAGAILYEAWKHDWGGIKQITEDTINYIKPIVTGLESFFESEFKSLEPTFKELGKSFESLEPLFTIVCKTISEVVEVAFKFMSDIIKVDISIIVEAIKILGPIFSTIFNGIGDTVSFFSNEFSEKINDVSNVLSWIEGVFSSIGNSISDSVSNMVSWVSGELYNLVSAVEGIGGDMEAAGANIIHSMLSGIEGAWGDVTGWISGKISALENIVGSETSHIISDITGSHATGLNFVPWDGYKAELHKGEMVLTADQATDFRNGSNTANTNITVNAASGNGEDIARSIKNVLNNMANGF